MVAEEKDKEKLTCMSEMKKLVRKAVKQNGVSKEDLIKSLDLKKDER